jgi:beta-glucosidase
MTELAPVKGMSATDVRATIEAVLAEATLPEKVGMMSGQGFFEQYKQSGGIWGAHAYRAGGGIERLGVPALYFTDGPRGVARGNSTCFPCSMARGASFDVELERRIGEVMGIEARAQGATLSGAVCINLLRHPAWGRAQETYGEDTHHLGEMGAALGLGIQTHNVVATVKHFALNSMENARFKVDVRVDERTLHEIYLPHFKRVLDAGIATVMSAYNKINGEYCGQNRKLLTEILRAEWGFQGFVHSDWVMGVYKPYGAAAGLDVENPEPLVFGEKLIAAIDAGHIEPQVIEDACRRILRVIYQFAAAEDPLPEYPVELVASEGHVALALEAAEKSAALLRNEGVLPLRRDRIRKLAVLGKLADMENTGDFGSSRVRPPQVITALEGLKRYLGDHAILAADEDDLEQASKVASEADACVVVVGYTADDEGEYIPGDISLGQEDGASPEAIAAQNDIGEGKASRGGDRTNLGLSEQQVALIRTAAEAGKPVIVVLVAGSAVMVEEWHDKTGAIIQTFYSGMEGGTALARLLFGEVSPSGRLPFTVATDLAHYPLFDRDADCADYGYWHGYAKFDAEELSPRYPFGHGLSYTCFSYRSLSARLASGAIEVSVAVRNDGGMPADEVVQVYAEYPGTVRPRARKNLKAFTRLSLQPGETKTARVSIPLRDLAYRCAASHDWRVERGDHKIIVARSAADPEALVTNVML